MPSVSEWVCYWSYQSNFSITLSLLCDRFPRNYLHRVGVILHLSLCNQDRRCLQLCFHWFSRFLKFLQLGSTKIGVKTNDGVVLAVEKSITLPLLVNSRCETFGGLLLFAFLKSLLLLFRSRAVWRKSWKLMTIYVVQWFVWLLMHVILVEHAREET